MKTRKRWVKSIIALTMALILCFGLIPYGKLGGVFAAGTQTVTVSKVDGEVINNDDVITLNVGESLNLCAKITIDGVDYTDTVPEGYIIGWYYNGTDGAGTGLDVQHEMAVAVTPTKAGETWINVKLFDSGWDLKQTAYFCLKASADSAGGNEGGGEAEEDVYAIEVTPGSGWTIENGVIAATAGDEIPLSASIKKNGEDIEADGENLHFYWEFDSGKSSAGADFDSWSGNPVTVKVSGKGECICSAKIQDAVWAELKKVEFKIQVAADPNAPVEEDSSIDAGIFVEKVPGLAEDTGFIHGMDVSSYIVEKESGVKYYDFKGKELDDQGFFNFLHDECEVNYIRVRIWNDPYYVAADGTKYGYGGGNNDLDKAIKIGKWATKAGMKVLIDFHYSDFWADPGKQQAPKAWASYTLAQKEAAVAQFTKESLTKILDAGVDVGMVQVGNETNNGIAGEKKTENMCAIFTAGCKAVDEIETKYNREILSVLHFTEPQNGFAGMSKALNDAKVPYDVFATSYYAESHGTPAQLKAALSHVADTYGKKVMVAENGYPYTMECGDEPGLINTDGLTLDYNVTMQGQSHEIREVINAVESINQAENTKGLALGFMYWEPAWVPVSRCDSTVDEATAQKNHENNKALWEKYGSGWAASYGGHYDETGDAGKWYGGSAADHKSLFDFSGKAMESILTFKYAKTGAKTTLKVDDVRMPEKVIAHKGETIPWPETVTVVYNDGSQKSCGVTWDAAQVKEASEKLGIHTVKGTLTVDGKSYFASVVVELLPKNYLKDGGFENGNKDNVWAIDNIKGEAAYVTQKEVGNAHYGNWHLHFWSAEDFEYEVTQTVTGLTAGVYQLSAYLQGGDAEKSVFELFAKSGETVESVTTDVDGYRDFRNPTVKRITVGTDGKITVGVHVSAVAGAWGGWDDFALYKVEELPMGTTTIGDAVDEIKKVDKNSETTPTVTFDMAADTQIPPEILTAMKGQNVDVVFKMAGYSWIINGKDVSEIKDDIDLQVEVFDSTKVFDKDISAAINTTAGDKKGLQVHLAYEGKFGFKATLQLAVGNEEDKGKIAKLYHYNTETKSLQYEMEAVIDGNGVANLELTHASDYVVVIDAAANPTPATPPTGDNSPIVLWAVLFAIAVACVAAGVALRRRARRA